MYLSRGAENIRPLSASASCRSASAHGQYGGDPSRSPDRPDRTRAPRLVALAANSCASVVLPIPASPATSTTWPRPRSASPSARPSLDNSRSRFRTRRMTNCCSASRITARAAVIVAPLVRCRQQGSRDHPRECSGLIARSTALFNSRIHSTELATPRYTSQSRTLRPVVENACWRNGV